MTVNETLTPDGPERNQRRVENHDYAAMLTRMLRSYRIRIAEGDIEDLAEFVRLVDHANTLLRLAALDVKEAGGYSWAEVAAPLGITRQAAYQRWGK